MSEPPDATRLALQIIAAARADGVNRRLEDGQPGAESSTVYFLSNFGGVQYGKFVCKHTHCGGRQQEDYLTALGLNPREVWHAQAGGAAPYDDLPPLESYGDAAE